MKNTLPQKTQKSIVTELTKMKKLTFLNRISVISTVFLFAASIAAASPHPVHHWTFDQIILEKIQKNLGRGDVAVGLTVCEQKMLQTYGLVIGDSIITEINGKVWELTRTSTGLRFERPAEAHSILSRPSLPVRRHFHVMWSSSSAIAYSPAWIWILESSIEMEIERRIANDSHIFLGLSCLQQKILGRYGIGIGQSFWADVGGMTVRLKRNSSGLTVLGHKYLLRAASVAGQSERKPV